MTPKDSKASRRAALEWAAVQILDGGRIPERTTPLAIASAIFPGPINPSLQVSRGIGATSMAVQVSGYLLRGLLTAPPTNEFEGNNLGGLDNGPGPGPSKWQAELRGGKNRKREHLK